MASMIMAATSFPNGSAMTVAKPTASRRSLIVAKASAGSEAEKVNLQVRKSKEESSSGRRDLMLAVVCVTGASGYIASWLVKFLLQRGYTVKASVGDPNDQKRTAHLTSLDGAKERLQLFKADLLQEGSFDSAIEGSEGVFHTVSPFYHDVKDPQSSSVKRVVLTSSIAAVAYNGKPRTPEVTADETWFSSPDLSKELQLWYVLSKTFAEEAAWKFVKEKGTRMVTINPAMVEHKHFRILLLDGSMSKMMPMLRFWRMRSPQLVEDICLVESVAHYSEIVKILRELYPSAPLPEKCADDKPFMPTYQVSKEKVKSLGIDYIPLKTSLKETADSLKEKQFVSF